MCVAGGISVCEWRVRGHRPALPSVVYLQDSQFGSGPLHSPRPHFLLGSVRASIWRSSWDTTPAPDRGALGCEAAVPPLPWLEGLSRPLHF